jgi:hypothetical protein
VRSFEDIEQAVNAIQPVDDPANSAKTLLEVGEEAMEQWVAARGEEPTDKEKEGFRVLALQRQGAKGEPSFNACRETCRELVYYYNLIILDKSHEDVAKRVRLMALVAKHLLYFVSGKMVQNKLGDFCCASKPIRANMN